MQIRLMENMKKMDMKTISTKFDILFMQQVSWRFPVHIKKLNQHCLDNLESCDTFCSDVTKCHTKQREKNK